MKPALKKTQKLSPEEKKTARKAKKEARKAKKAAKANSSVLYIPEKMQGFRFSLTIGYLLRFFAIAFSVFGVLWLFCDAFLLEEVKAGNLLLFCFGAVTAFSLIFIGKWFILVGIGIIAAYIGIFFAVAGNPLTFFVSGTGEVINRMMARLSDAGFAALGTVNFPNLGGLRYAVSREQTLTYGGIFALAAVLALIFAAFSAKRTRLLPMLITGGGLCTICFTYNLCETNWGIACVLAGLCSAAVLSAYDKIYKEHKHSKKSRAYSGYSAALAGLLALATILIPASTITEPWGEIDFIAAPMNEARTVLTTILTGGNPEYNKMNSLTDERSNALEEITFDNVVLFEVQSYSKRAIYLRSWIAKDYNYETNAWNQLSTADNDAMLRELRNESPTFIGDQITYDRYTLIDGRLNESSLTENLYVRDPKLGYAATFVDVNYIKNSGLLYLLPSAYVTETGLLEFESRTESYHENYDRHADGMYTSGWFNLFKQYSTVAILPDYITNDYSKISADTIRYFEILFEFTAQANGSELTPEVQLDNFRYALDAEGLTAFNTDALKDYLELTDTERARWYNRYLHLYQEYTDYVHANYIQVPENSPGIDQIYAELSDDIESAETDHDKIMTIIRHLTDKYAYTTAPTISDERQYANDLDYFLLEGKEGYCVQFATAATLLLRKAGYPARYVQGYIADEFERSEDAEGRANYISEVTDSKAHAWVEVYIDGLGWRTYETTPAFYEALYYREGITTPDPDVTTAPMTDLTTPTTAPTTSADPSETDTAGEDSDSSDSGITINPAQAGKVLIALCMLALITALIIRQVRHARKIADGRAYYIDRAEYGNFEEKSDFDQVAGVLCDSIYEVHYILGNRPKPGELPSEFAARIDSRPIDDSKQALRIYNRLSMLPSTLSEVTTLIAKQEFGKTMNRSELAILGAYLRALIASEYPGLPLWKKLWYRYIKFMI